MSRTISSLFCFVLFLLHTKNVIFALSSYGGNGNKSNIENKNSFDYSRYLDNEIRLMQKLVSRYVEIKMVLRGEL